LYPQSDREKKKEGDLKRDAAMGKRGKKEKREGGGEENGANNHLFLSLVREVEKGEGGKGKEKKKGLVSRKGKEGEKKKKRARKDCGNVFLFQCRGKGEGRRKRIMTAVERMVGGEGINEKCGAV